jgi:hypothetical protein
MSACVHEQVLSSHYPLLKLPFNEWNCKFSQITEFLDVVNRAEFCITIKHNVSETGFV